MTKLKFNQQNCGKVEIKSNDLLEFKFNQIVVELKLKYLSHHKPQIDSNPNYRTEIKLNKPL
jgi:hypothetical protein